MSDVDAIAKRDDRNMLDVLLEALEGADRVVVETRNALGEMDAHYLHAPEILTSILSERDALTAHLAEQALRHLADMGQITDQLAEARDSALEEAAAAVGVSMNNYAADHGSTKTPPGRSALFYKRKLCKKIRSLKTQTQET